MISIEWKNGEEEKENIEEIEMLIVESVKKESKKFGFSRCQSKQSLVKVYLAYDKPKKKRFPSECENHAQLKTNFLFLRKLIVHFKL